MKEFEELFREFTPVVYHYLISLCGNESLAEELTAETLYRAYLHIGQFRGDCRVETWLCQIAKNALIKEQKRQNRFSTATVLEGAADTNVFDALANREQALRIHKHLHTLKDPYREVFMLRVFGELGFKEIAGIFGKSESWAKVTFYRAKSKLIEVMEGT